MNIAALYMAAYGRPSSSVEEIAFFNMMYYSINTRRR